jgi:HK97 family phage prohead protease
MKPLTRSELEFKSIPLDLKKFAPATGEFEGYASTFGNEDQGQDVVCKGAFIKSLTQRPITRVKMLYEHDTTQPIGKWTEAYEDERGLMVKGKLLVDSIAKAREVHALMSEQILDGLSIGFRVAPGGAETDRGSSVRLLKDLELHEISAVLFPMNVEAGITSVKADLLWTEREFERLFTQDAEQLGLPKLTRSEVRMHLMPGIKSLIKAKQDAGGEKVASKQPDVDWSALADGLRRLTDEASRS